MALDAEETHPSVYRLYNLIKSGKPYEGMDQIIEVQLKALLIL